MSRFLLALLLAFEPLLPPAFSQSAEAPVNLVRQPDAVSTDDKALLGSLGYTIDETIHRGSEAPLTARQLADVLARLKSRPREASATTSPDVHFNGARAGVVIQRVQRVWNKATGEEISSTVQLYEGDVSGASGRAVSTAHRTIIRRAAGDDENLHDAVAGTLSMPGPARPLAFVRPPVLTPSSRGEFRGAVFQPNAGAAALTPVADKKKPARPAVTPVPAPATSSPSGTTPPHQGPKAPAGRLASLFLSDDFLTQILVDQLKGAPVKEIDVQLDPVKQQVKIKGLFKLPPQAKPDRSALFDLSALPPFRLEVAIQLKTTREGYLILEFPLEQTFFYPADSQQPDQDRVIVPVQLLQIILNATHLAEKLNGTLSFANKREIHLNQALSTRRNVVILKFRLDQFVPILKGIELGGIRIVEDTKDGEGENFLAIDLVPEAK